MARRLRGRVPPHRPAPLEVAVPAACGTDVDQLVLRELRMQLDVHQPPESRRLDVVGQSGDGIRIELPVAHEAQLAASLGDEDAAVWQKRHRPRLVEALGDCDLTGRTSPESTMIGPSGSGGDGQLIPGGAVACPRPRPAGACCADTATALTASALKIAIRFMGILPGEVYPCTSTEAREE